MSPEQITELVRRRAYEVDCRAVADAILARIAVPSCALGSEDVLVTGERALRAPDPHP